MVLGACALTTASTLAHGSVGEFCLANQPCFPPESVLTQFNATVSGRLYSERPIGAVCYKGSFNQAACNEVANHTSSSNWRVERFPAYQYVNWETCSSTDNCNATTVVRDRTCAQGSVPNYAVHAETAQDVVEYVRFATKHNLRIVIKNTGHDILGRSTGKGGFALWTHKMKGIQFNETFIPDGSPKEIDGGFVTVEAGVQWGEAYKFADSMGRILVGGGATSVGAAGGFPLGGGYSLLSPSLGLGLNNIVELELVTADGQLRKVNEFSHPDLFWAVRGGGGGTWGATTKITYRTHPRSELYIFSVDGLSPNMTDAVARETVVRWVKLAPTLGDLGVGGVSMLSERSLTIAAMVQSSFANITQLKHTLAPFTSWLAEQGVLHTDLESTANGTPIYTNYTSWYDYFNHTMASDTSITPDTSAGTPSSITSRLVPRHYYESDPEGLADVLVQVSKAGSIIMGMTGPLRYAKDHPTAINSTSVTPVWYQSPWHIMPLSGEVARLREYAKDGGAYFGESDINEPDAASAYWSSNYPALLRAKAKWDPENVFQVWHGVGSPSLGNGTQSICA
ncbi:FAD-binding domain protein [Rhizoctonia solani AG-3 Rhs1AP]|uniref:FAD-binding domain protein n=1 Tax=Rhizoctonia solani AG-3 Rhs1AP TaxID=1086054 RepID=X8JJJ8_9AGAM|nr:FAD-binding domain protein [Rhizoctonia solani AG-3 Rhs1AP]